jgi:hypothetical protein
MTMAADLAASDDVASAKTNVIAMAMIMIVLRGEVDL